MKENNVFIPKGNLAVDNDAALKAKREELKKKLLEGGKITLKQDGSATDEKGSDSTISIPKGKLADNDAALKAKREELKKKLLEGGKITLKNNGSATDEKGTDSTISIPKGKLAGQWYENDPTLLELERVTMRKNFPNFELERMEDGRLA
jgi:predicted NUDIX family NTP pyrophosphohydrolase